MDDGNQNKELPSDDELAAMIGRGKRRKRNPDKPSPRFPEALYYYLFILVEALVLIGVWGFMGMGFDAAVSGPGLDAPVVAQFLFHLESLGRGILDVFLGRPWVVAAVMLASAAVFVPATPRKRKRMATMVSIAIVALFVILIALQFSEDMNRIGQSTPF